MTLLIEGLPTLAQYDILYVQTRHLHAPLHRLHRRSCPLHRRNTPFPPAVLPPRLHPTPVRRSSDGLGSSCQAAMQSQSAGPCAHAHALIKPCCHAPVAPYWAPDQPRTPRLPAMHSAPLARSSRALTATVTASPRYAKHTVGPWHSAGTHVSGGNGSMTLMQRGDPGEMQHGAAECSGGCGFESCGRRRS